MYFNNKGDEDLFRRFRITKEEEITRFIIKILTGFATKLID